MYRDQLLKDTATNGNNYLQQHGRTK